MRDIARSRAPDSAMVNRKTRILVVDNEEAMREVLEKRLQDWGFEVRLAGNAPEAAALAQSWDPDMVISDVIMPGMSGLDLLRTLMDWSSSSGFRNT